ncbi:hypothetical protein M409DRAFT_21777 [Zasmidium cellare ATCC 36951]|uniref:Early meiotic induction protein 1 n=1 Tax=Zasmidium cellare ATCC 36951 TaxID=1080233 RepID=A0A6A6CNW1_ZASCE|nr:uncharacterized protein M409DRAFT_21777 [Zasmidium cellare ATCC 36951]KAF2168343.1 hypothetical protein M409DRAFT_21777 [Zasmidium cellare ATCC 36951]
MGWLWPFSSSASSKEAAPTQSSDHGADHAPQTSSVALTEDQRLRIFGRPGPAITPQPQTQEDKADAELEALIKSFAAEANDTKSSPNSTQTQTIKPEPTPEPEPSRILPDGSLDISPEAIYPRTMSCRQQFDQAFYCQSLGGKFNDIYRYGHLNSCSEQWGAFWFCMRNRTLPEKAKAEAIKNFYKERDERRKREWGSSEDVWEIRKVAVDRAFWKDPDREDEDMQVKE